jgi:hypothetical protein
VILPALLALAAGPGRVAGAPSALVWREGNSELARRVLAETHVATTPSGPRIADYFGVLLESALRSIATALAATFAGAGGVLPVLRLVALAIVLAAVVLVLFSVIRRVLARRRRDFSPAGSRIDVAGAAPRRRDAAAWRREIEVRLAGGDVAGALEALWWWFAESLSATIADPVDSSWTTRELLVRAARRDLARVGVELDILLYGLRRPTASDVSASLERFEKSVR